MKRFLFSAFFLLATLTCFAAKEASHKAIPLSFTQVSTSATITKLKDNTGLYRLTINNVSPYITYYSDRPARATGLATLPNFVKAWQSGGDSFQKNNPNAVLYAGLLHGQPNRGDKFYVIQIANPKYDAAQNKITYLIGFLGKQLPIFDSITLNYVMLVIN